MVLCQDCCELFAVLNVTQVEEGGAEFYIKLKFNAAGAPHFSGVWERPVISRKKVTWNPSVCQLLKGEQSTTVFWTVERLLTNKKTDSSQWFFETFGVAYSESFSFDNVYH